MSENIIKSKKIKTNKFKLLWVAIIAVLVFVTAFPVIKYLNYKEGQKLAISILEHNYGYDEIAYLFYEYRDDFFIADISLGETLTEAGFDCYLGSDYLKYDSFFEYTLNGLLTLPILILFLILLAIAIAIVIFLNILYNSDMKNEMIIDGDTVICKKGKKTIKKFMIKDITSVSSAGKNGLKVLGTGIKYQIKNIKNSDEIKAVIMNNISSNKKAPAVIKKQEATPGDIIKYKELLDEGVISQEEFEQKKKQLLGL